MDYSNVKSKAVQYQKVIENTIRYREEWHDTTRKMLEEQLEAIIEETGLKATIEHKDDLDNLQAVALSLGQAASGISEQVGEAERHLIKSKGMLVYQQLFNGKLMVSVMYPFIEGLGQPKPPKMIEILRPEELKEAYILRHTEEFLKEIISWEDYDDDMPTQPIGFQTNFDRDNLIQSMEKS